jgi:hypothetical protein
LRLARSIQGGKKIGRSSTRYSELLPLSRFGLAGRFTLDRLLVHYRKCFWPGQKWLDETLVQDTCFT